MQPIHRIDLHSVAEDAAQATLFPVLEKLFPVKFVRVSTNQSDAAGLIFIDAEKGQPEREKNQGSHILSVPKSTIPSTQDELKKVKVQFADDVNVPFPFRGRVLTVKVANEPHPLTLSAGEIALAKTEQGIIWCVSTASKATQARSAFALPELTTSGGLQDVLNGDRFLELLPLLHFLRAVCSDELFAPPPLRAQFMFDDPNLHWPSYGYVDYKEIAARAERENYHVSFATVPLDTWMTHGQAADIFKTHPKRLSFCVHGNNHTKRELAQEYSATERTALLQQALRRVERLERKSGVTVSRVMVPPHGACSHEMLEELPQRGFESACISHGSLRAHNRSRTWIQHLGYLPLEMIGDCPVLPRWGLANSSENTILLAAYLRQPIILRGHHQDIKGGIELLDGFARIINSLGDVIWTNMTDISRLNYSSRTDGSTLRVKPLGRKLTVSVPESARSLLVESPSVEDSRIWQLLETGKAAAEIRRGAAVPLSASGKRTVTLEAALPPTAPCEVNGSMLPVAAFVRRLLTEGRDRLVGALGR